MKSALCVDDLVLQGVVLPMHGSGATARSGASKAHEIPILAAPNGLKPPIYLRETDNNDDCETRSETATVAADEDERMTQQSDEKAVATAAPAPVTPSNLTRTIGFLERVMREYSVKREIQALITKKQQQLKHMQALISTYQELLLKTVAQLGDETQQLQTELESHQKESRSKLAELLATGATRELVETTRCLGLLQQQKFRVRKEQAALRVEIIRTRQEECEWLRKSIQTQHDDECELLLSPATAKKFLEEGSLQATLAVQITQNDPIFAAVEQLLEAPPQIKQLQLQLDSLDSVVRKMQLKREELEDVRPVTGSTGPVPLVKRSSFRERRVVEAFPSAERKRDVRLGLLEAKRIRVNMSMENAAKHEQYTAQLSNLGRILEDMRTRSGRLLHQFSEQMHEDTLAWVGVKRTLLIIGGEGNQEQEEEHSKPAAEFHDQYFIPRLALLLTSPRGDASESVYEGWAVDCRKLSPPAMVSAFTKFLLRVISTEYELLTVPVASNNDNESEDDEDERTAHDDKALDQAVLQDCVHEMVFTRIHAVSFASAMEESRFHEQEQPEHSVSPGFLFPWHWTHAKARIQQLSPAELAFPDEILGSVMSYLATHADEIAKWGFLPKTLAMFRAAERETTPKGVVRAVMAGFRTLHHEILPVLAADDQRVCDGRRKPRRRGSCFLNADVLIPSLVLMMCRLPHASCLDQLWLRAKLVEAFRTAALSEGGEEAYYLTCLAAAIEFIQTYEPGSDGSATTPAQACIDCEHARARHVTIEVREVSAAITALSETTSGLMQQGRRRSLKQTAANQTAALWGKTEHDSIKQLSKWISTQPPTDTSMVLADTERFVVPYELWTPAT